MFRVLSGPGALAIAVMNQLHRHQGSDCKVRELKLGALQAVATAPGSDVDSRLTFRPSYFPGALQK